MTQDDWSGPLGLGLLRERMNRLFDEGLRRDEGRIGEPAADVYSTPDRLVVSIELPGVPESAVAITAEGPTLVVRGERPRRRAAESHRLERSSGAFQCRVQLPPDAVGRAHVARLERGVLTIEIPRRT